jgi:hypothetical protein
MKETHRRTETAENHEVASGCIGLGVGVCGVLIASTCGCPARWGRTTQNVVAFYLIDH